jgi:hypothetical protein
MLIYKKTSTLIFLVLQLIWCTTVFTAQVLVLYWYTVPGPSRWDALTVLFTPMLVCGNLREFWTRLRRPDRRKRGEVFGSAHPHLELLSVALVSSLIDQLLICYRKRDEWAPAARRSGNWAAPVSELSFTYVTPYLSLFLHLPLHRLTLFPLHGTLCVTCYTISIFKGRLVEVQKCHEQGCPYCISIYVMILLRVSDLIYWTLVTRTLQVNVTVSWIYTLCNSLSLQYRWSRN